MARTTPVLFIIILLLSICATYATNPAQHVLIDKKHNNATGNATLTFDSLPPTNNTLAPFTHNTHLDFSSFAYFNSTSASASHLVSATDADCAYSSPHALFAWRSRTPSLWPRITLNATVAAAAGLSPYFDLLGLAIKPMNFTPRYTILGIDAYGIDFSTPDGVPEIKTHYGMFSMQLWEGPRRQALVEPAEHWPGWGKGVNMVEMWAETEKGEDWPFCVDDLHVRFKAEGQGESESAGGEAEARREWEEVKEGGVVMRAWRTV